MKSFNLSKVAAALVLGSSLALSYPLASSCANDRSEGRAKKEKFALMVGINDYSPYSKGPEDPDHEGDLFGCVEDITDMRELLTQFYEFADDSKHIKILLDKEATREAIIAAFRSHLVENARKNPDGIFVFHYSGHGASGIRDFNLDEKDRADECIVTSESDAIVDDELGALTRELTDATKNNKEANITLIFDCCQSATVSRGRKGMRIRQRPLNTIALDQIEKRGQANAGKSPSISNGYDLVPRSDRYIAISACHSSQFEPETNDQPSNGVLTRYLTEILKTSTKAMSYRDLRERLAARITSTYGTDPQIEGDIDRLIFGGASSKSDPYIRVGSAVDRVKIEAGTAHGVMKDSVIAFYKPEATQLSGSKNLIGQGTVSESRAYYSIVDMKGAVKPVDVARSKAILVTPGFTTAPVVLAVVTQRAPQLQEKTFRQFKDSLDQETKNNKSIGVMEVYSEADLARLNGWDAALVFDSFGKLSEILKQRGVEVMNPDSLKPADDDVVYFLTDRTAQPLFNFWVRPDDKDAGKKIARVLMARARQQALFSLVNATDSPMNRAIKVDLIKITDWSTTADGGLIIKKEQAASDNRFKDGDLYRFNVSNLSKVPVYLNVLSLGTSGKILPIYPFEGDSEAIAPGRVLKIPSEGAIKANLPAGIDTYRFVVSDKLIDFSFLKQGEISTRDGTNDNIRTLAEKSSLTQLLFGAMTRDPSIVKSAPPPDQWGTMKVDCEVLPPHLLSDNKKDPVAEQP